MKLGYTGHCVIEFIDSHTPKAIKRTIKRMLPGVAPKYYSCLARLTRSGMLQVTIRGGSLAGRPFICTLKDERPFWIGNWEPEVQSLLQQHLRPGHVVYDVGAHVGYFSLMAAHLVQPSGQVFAFEPSPANRALAQKNLSLKPDLAAITQLLPLAVSDQSGFAALLSGEEKSTTASIIRDGNSSGRPYVQVSTTSLDEFVQHGNPPPHLIKMDIEGGETHAFRGIAEVLRRHRPLLIVEIHDVQASAAFHELLGRVGYLATKVSEVRYSANPDWENRDQYLAIPAEHSEDTSIHPGLNSKSVLVPNVLKDCEEGTGCSPCRTRQEHVGSNSWRG